MLGDLLFRLRALVRRKAVEGEMDEELRFHVERQVEKYVASGLARAEALRRARIEFGGMEASRSSAGRRGACTRSKRSGKTCGTRCACGGGIRDSRWWRRCHWRWE